MCIPPQSIAQAPEQARCDAPNVSSRLKLREEEEPRATSSAGGCHRRARRSPAAKQIAAASIGAPRNCGGSTAAGESIQCFPGPTFCIGVLRSSLSRPHPKLHYRLLVIRLRKKIHQVQPLNRVLRLQNRQVTPQCHRIARHVHHLPRSESRKQLTSFRAGAGTRRIEHNKIWPLALHHGLAQKIHDDSRHGSMLRSNPLQRQPQAHVPQPDSPQLPSPARSFSRERARTIPRRRRDPTPPAPSRSAHTSSTICGIRNRFTWKNPPRAIQ